jgi:hypothetical protein
MPMRFESQDIEKLKGLLKYHPEGKKAENVITCLMDLQDLANNLRYPINSFSDFEKQLGSNQTVKFGEVQIKLSDIRPKVHAYYFPIPSEENFFEKVSEMMKWNTATVTQNVGTTKGEINLSLIGYEVSPSMAPPIPEALVQLMREMVPVNTPGSCGFGLREDELKKLLSQVEESGYEVMK